MSSLLPLSSSTKEEKQFESVALKGLDLDIKYLTTLPKEASEEILPYLAYMFDVDISGLEIPEQRILIQNALEIHRYEGTFYAVKKAIDASFDDAFIMEWFEKEDKKAYTFDVKVKINSDTNQVFHMSNFKKARALINSAKNARSHFNNFVIDLPDADGDIKKAETSNFNVKLKNELKMPDMYTSIKKAQTSNFNLQLKNELKIPDADGHIKKAQASSFNVNLKNELQMPNMDTHIKKIQTNSFNIELKSELKMKDIDFKPNLKGVAVWII